MRGGAASSLRLCLTGLFIAGVDTAGEVPAEFVQGCRDHAQHVVRPFL